MSLSQFKEDLVHSIYGMTKAEAHAKGVCIQCKKPPVFTSKMGPKEYLISRLCDPCFDSIFAMEEE